MKRQGRDSGREKHPREIFAKLFDSEDGYDLVWSRPRPKDKTAPKAPAE